MKNILIILGVLVLITGIYYIVKGNKEEVTNDTVGDRVMNPEDRGENPPEGEGKLKAANFSGKLETVNTACFADGECFVVVDGKHVTTMMGWSRATWGSVQGVDGIGGLEAHIGEGVEVYAQDKSDGMYTLEGSEGFYIRLE